MNNSLNNAASNFYTRASQSIENSHADTETKDLAYELAQHIRRALKEITDGIMSSN